MCMRKTFELLTIVALVVSTASASEIRVSLLDDASVLDETAQLLERNGSSAESIEAFKRAVRFHHTDLFDGSRFPARAAGYYLFKNVDALNVAMPDPFCEQTKTNDLSHNSLVCLDVAVLLVRDAGAGALLLRDNFAEKHFAKRKNESTQNRTASQITSVTNFSFYQDGRTLMYPKTVYTWITGLARMEREVDLAVSLKGERRLPDTYNDTTAPLQKMFSDWNALRRKDGLKFPDKIQIITGGYLSVHDRYVTIDHIAICVRDGSRIVFLEKNGPRGPFLRADFNSEDEITRYFVHKLLPASHDSSSANFNEPVFVSINDRLLAIVNP